MKKILLILPVLCFLFISCSKEDPEYAEEMQQPEILSINLMTSSVAKESQVISVTIIKPTPCHEITDVQVGSSGNTVNYDFILPDLSNGTFCTTVIQEETVTVNFTPETGGEYTLNFLINGTLAETRIITVSE